jgi:glycosyltransferase involved in cell wall biosynthesis
MNILVLYTRLTGYWIACMRKDYELNGNNYLVFRTPPSKDAPFKIESEAGIEICDYNTKEILKIQAQITDFKPDVIYVSGWSNKDYLKIVKVYKTKGLPVVAGMDNQWLGTMKQRMASFFSFWLIHKYISHIWVPGKPQYFYARKLGFKPQNILSGLYCADEVIFKDIVQHEHKKELIFVGRIVDHKGVKELFEVIEELIFDQQFKIKLHIIGNGPLEHLIPKHKKIKHTAFVDPDKLPQLLSNAGTFILPSLYEAWGVVVHEAAIAGLPIITTYQCGAGTDLVIERFNGYKYNAKDKDHLRQIIKKVTNQSAEDYFKMSVHSKFLGSKLNLTNWSAQINTLKNYYKT